MPPWNRNEGEPGDAGKPSGEPLSRRAELSPVLPLGRPQDIPNPRVPQFKFRIARGRFVIPALMEREGSRRAGTAHHRKFRFYNNLGRWAVPTLPDFELTLAWP